MILKFNTVLLFTPIPIARESSSSLPPPTWFMIINDMTAVHSKNGPAYGIITGTLCADSWLKTVDTYELDGTYQDKTFNIYPRSGRWVRTSYEPTYEVTGDTIPISTNTSQYMYVSSATPLRAMSFGEYELYNYEIDVDGNARLKLYDENSKDTSSEYYIEMTISAQYSPDSTHGMGGTYVLKKIWDHTSSNDPTSISRTSNLYFYVGDTFDFDDYDPHAVSFSGYLTGLPSVIITIS